MCCLLWICCNVFVDLIRRLQIKDILGLARRGFSSHPDVVRHPLQLSWKPSRSKAQELLADSGSAQATNHGAAFEHYLSKRGS